MWCTMQITNFTISELSYAQVTHSQTGRRIRLGYNQASFVANP